MKWQTKTVQIESADLQWDGSEESLAVIRDFVDSEDFIHYSERSLMRLKVWNTLEEQWLNVPIGHWVVKGLKGEFYPCEPGAMDGKYFEFEPGDEVSLFDLVEGLKSVGESLSGPDYIKDSDMIDMGDYLQEIATKIERYGIK